MMISSELVEFRVSAKILDDDANLLKAETHQMSLTPKKDKLSWIIDAY